MKRFTETEKWRDSWFRKLELKLKALWQYICDSCDAAGVIDPDYEMMSLQIGVPITEEDFKKFGEKVIALPNGKFLIAKFVSFQYGQLSEICKPHKPVFDSLRKHSLHYDPQTYLVTPKTVNNLETLSKGIGNPFEGFPIPSERVQEKEKDKDKEKDKEKDWIGEGSKGRGFTPPTFDEVSDYMKSERLPPIEAEKFFNFHQSKGWVVGKSPMKDWHAAIRTWKINYLDRGGELVQPRGFFPGMKKWQIRGVEMFRDDDEEFKIRHAKNLLKDLTPEDEEEFWRIATPQFIEIWKPIFDKIKEEKINETAAANQ
jgi:hypothetical protein